MTSQKESNLYKRFKIRNIKVIITFCCFFLFFHETNSQISFSYQSSWKYFKGKDAVSLSPLWVNPEFNDAGWLTGKSPLRYGNGVLGVELTDMQNSYTTVYMRSTFFCLNKDLISSLTLSVDYDDGYIIWINGREAARKNAPSVLLNTAVATLSHESGTGEDVVLEAAKLNLAEGINSIAVQGFNVSLTSTDFYIDVSINAESDLPEFNDPAGISFSVRSGFCNDHFDVILTSSDPAASIKYTLNGSNPQSSARYFTGSSPLAVHIDPSDTTGRALTPSVILRASSVKPGFKPSKPSAATYIFQEKLKTQSFPGGDWPSYNVNTQIIDLGIDQRVVNDPLYSPSFISSFKSIPSVSIITDNKNLFDPASGIYVNADGHGINWEKECSVELINPDGSEGFKINAGLRIRGGWSRHDTYPKHSFRLFFREKYGSAKLNFPLFGEEGVSEFDKIDLRTEQNYAWNNGLSNNSFVRDVFSRDIQRDMGQPYTRSRYYHLYLNGMYWGIYQTQERSEARFASSYFGEDDEDYDVVKVNTENWSHLIEVTDGNLDSWKKIWDLSVKGFASDANYYLLQGRDEEGKPVRGGEVMVDIDNLIDYMLIIFYTGNFDAPASSFSKNKYCNNFYAIADRPDKSSGFMFFAHDSEHSAFDEPHTPGIGINEDRVNLGTRTDNMTMLISSFSYFHPQWLHFKLTANSEYRSRFSSRAYNHFKTGGVFSPEMALASLNKRVAEVENAIVAESARWGDAKRTTGNPYTKNGQWLTEIDKIRSRFIPLRPAIVKSQLASAGLYPDSDAPVISTSLGIVTSKEQKVTNPVIVRISNPNSKGLICYTLNGNDPRKDGGSINSGTVSSDGEASLKVSESTVIKARILTDGKWSAITEVNFIKEQSVYTGLKITEIYYHPADFRIGADTISGQDLEFLEFRNTGKNAVNLSGLELDSAVSYSFPNRRLLAPGEYFVVASKPARFWDYYGLIPSGNFSGNLSNAGEEILLKDDLDKAVINFAYDDSYPWPDKADGEGYSLSSVLNNPTGNPSDLKYWKNSSQIGGTPFGDNLSEGPHTVMPADSLSVYPNPTSGEIKIDLTTEDLGGQIEMTLFDVTGNQIYSVTTGTSAFFNLKNLGLAPGSYTLRVKSQCSISRMRIILVN